MNREVDAASKEVWWLDRYLESYERFSAQCDSDHCTAQELRIMMLESMQAGARDTAMALSE